VNTFPSKYRQSLVYREDIGDYALKVQFFDANEKPMEEPWIVYEWKKKPLPSTVSKTLWIALRGIDIYAHSIKARIPILEELK
jgi:hypothetical protein